MSLAAQLKTQREADERALAAAIAQCTKLIQSMRFVTPAAAERTVLLLAEFVKHTPKLPLEMKRKLLAEARALECAANMRATDATLHQALEKARENAPGERNRLIGEARRFCSKAAALGAEAGFKLAVQRKIEIIMMTGGVEAKGPTLAKPRSG